MPRDQYNQDKYDDENPLSDLRSHKDPHAIEKYQFLYHFLPHPQKKIRAGLLSHKAILVYSFALFLLIGAIKVLPRIIPGVLGYASDISVVDLFSLTNTRRGEAGLGSLKLNPVLSQAAQKKAEHMFKNNYWAHVAPDGTEPWDFILLQGYDYAYAGENLAKNFSISKEVVEAWYRSPSHKDNLFSENYDEVGFAVVDGVLEGYETTLVVQMFGRPRNPKMVVSPKEETQLLEAMKAPQQAQIPVQVHSEVLPAVDVVAVSKSITLLLAGFLTVLLALDVWYSKRKAIPKLTGHTFAHITLLILTIMGVWIALSPGKIL